MALHKKPAPRQKDAGVKGVVQELVREPITSTKFTVDENKKPVLPKIRTLAAKPCIENLYQPKVKAATPRS